MKHMGFNHLASMRDLDSFKQFWNRSEMQFYKNSMQLEEEMRGNDNKHSEEHSMSVRISLETMLMIHTFQMHGMAAILEIING